MKIILFLIIIEMIIVKIKFQNIKLIKKNKNKINKIK